jgi:hypothetical protein
MLVKSSNILYTEQGLKLMLIPPELKTQGFLLLHISNQPRIGVYRKKDF